MEKSRGGDLWTVSGPSGCERVPLQATVRRPRPQWPQPGCTASERRDRLPRIRDLSDLNLLPVPLGKVSMLARRLASEPWARHPQSPHLIANRNQVGRRPLVRECPPGVGRFRSIPVTVDDGHLLCWL